MLGFCISPVLRKSIVWQSGRRQRLKSYLNSPITQHLLAWSLVAIVGLVVNAIGFFYWGYDYGLRSIGASANEVQQLRQQAKQQTQQIPALQQQLAIAQQNLDIAQKTTQQLQQDNKNQLASVADMQEQIRVAKLQAQEADRICTQYKVKNAELEDKINVWHILEK